LPNPLPGLSSHLSPLHLLVLLFVVFFSTVLCIGNPLVHQLLFTLAANSVFELALWTSCRDGSGLRPVSGILKYLPIPPRLVPNTSPSSGKARPLKWGDMESPGLPNIQAWGNASLPFYLSNGDRCLLRCLPLSDPLHMAEEQLLHLGLIAELTAAAKACEGRETPMALHHLVSRYSGLLFETIDVLCVDSQELAPSV